MNLTGTDFNTALVAFLVPYALLTVPANLIIWCFKPSICCKLGLCLRQSLFEFRSLPRLISVPVYAVTFGIFTVLQGIVSNFAGLITVRVFLGIAQAGIFPGCMYTLSRFYTRAEAQTRFAVFLMSTTFAGAFGGLFAAAIGNMNGICGMLAWRWIFILEGCLTVVVGFLLFFFITDLPEKAKGLRGDELRALQIHLHNEDDNWNDANRDNGNEAKRIPSVSFRDFTSAILDIKMWLAGLIYLGIVMPVSNE